MSFVSQPAKRVRLISLWHDKSVSIFYKEGIMNVTITRLDAILSTTKLLKSTFGRIYETHT